MIRIGDREIPPSKLDTEFFTIYWYSFKSEMSDGWHIDGRIVAKNGYLTVKKDFVGMPEAIEEVKKDYYIQVDMDEKLLDGKPQPPAFHEHMKLVLPSEDSQKPDAEAPQAEDAPIEVVGTWTDDTHTNILVMINKACSVEDDVIVNVIFINMGADHVFIFSFQYFVCKLLP